MQALHQDRDKLRDPSINALLSPPRPQPLTQNLSPSYNPTLLTTRFARLAAVESARLARRLADAEPYYGLDVKKDPQRFKEIPPNTPLFGWVQAGQRLWRTIRFESPKPVIVGDEGTAMIGIKRIHYTLHILLNLPATLAAASSMSPSTSSTVPTLNPNPPQIFDLILRVGTAPFTAQEGSTQRSTLPSRPAVDLHIERFQACMLAEGMHCVGDVSNPTVFQHVGANVGVGGVGGVGPSSGAPYGVYARPSTGPLHHQQQQQPAVVRSGLVPMAGFRPIPQQQMGPNQPYPPGAGQRPGAPM